MKIMRHTCLLCALILLVGCMMSPTKSIEIPNVILNDKYKNIPHINLSDYPVVDGSTATFPLAIALIREITNASQQEAENYTSFNTTDPSYSQLADGSADMLLVYEASDKTKETLSEYAKFRINPVGRDALVFLVNDNNPVRSLSTKQLRDIYMGTITNWSELGGNDLEIVAFQRQEESGSQTLMKKLIMGANMPDIEFTPVNSMQGLVDKIGSFDATANALGYSVYYYVNNMYIQPNIRILAVDGVIPSNETIQSGEYPHINDFFCVLPETPKQEVLQISDWMLSDEGQNFIKECGYVPVY